MLLLTGIVFFTGVLTMWEHDDPASRNSSPWSFLLVAGVFGLFISLDLFFIFVWYDVSLFPMYLLIAVWGSTRKEYGAMKLTLYLLAGSALILPGSSTWWSRLGLETFDITGPDAAGTFTPAISRSSPSCSSTSASAFWPASGRFTPGPRWATWRRPPPSA
jgi:NADH-quinone oxidoreductase subunit M